MVTNPARTAGDYEVTERFERFTQRDDVFSRSFWDPRIRDDKTDSFYATYRRPLDKWRSANGFTQRLATGRLRRVALWLHDRADAGRRLKPVSWWQARGGAGRVRS